MKIQRLSMLLALLVLPASSYAAMLGNVASNVARAMQFQGCMGSVADVGTEDFFTITGCIAKTQVAAEGNAMQNIPIGGTVTNLNCYLTTAAGVKTVAGGTSYTLALRQNAVDTALTCAITAAQMSCTDTTHSVTVATADELDFSILGAGAPTALEGHCSALYAF